MTANLLPRGGDARQGRGGRCPIGANFGHERYPCCGGLAFSSPRWIADVADDFGKARHDFSRPHHHQYGVEDCRTQETTIFPGRITISMALRIAGRRRLCSLQRDSDCAVGGFIVTGRRVENVGDGLVDHQRQDQMGCQPASSEPLIAYGKLMDSPSTLSRLKASSTCQRSR